MKTILYFKYFILLAGIFLFDACKDDDFEAPSGVKITFQATSLLKSTANTILLEEAYIGIGNIDLKRVGENDSAAIEKIVYDGPYVADLLNGTISPAIRWIFAEPGSYREIEIKTHKALTGGMTIILRGTIMPSDGSGEIPFELITAREYTLNIENNTGIEVREGENVDLLVVFDLSDLFKGIDVSSLDKNENGILVISEEAASNTVALLIDKFNTFSSFGINDGLFPGNTADENPDNEAPEGDEDTGEEADGDTSDGESGDNPDGDNSGDGDTGGTDESGDEDEGGTDESGDNPDDGEDENDPGAGSEDSGSSGDGTNEDDEKDENSGEAGSGDGPAGNGDSPVDGTGDTPGNGNDGNSGNEDEEGPGDEAGDEGSDNEPGDAEGDDDSPNDGSNEGDSDDQGENDEGTGNDEGENDEGTGNDEGGNDEESGDDDGDDDEDNRDDDGDNDDDDDDDDDDKKKDKGNSGKGNNGNSGGGKKK